MSLWGRRGARRVAGAIPSALPHPFKQYVDRPLDVGSLLLG